jgi:signal transduction histidine kinase
MANIPSTTPEQAAALKEPASRDSLAELQAANQLIGRIGSILTLTDLKPALVKATAEMIGCERAVLLLVDDDAQLRIEAVSDQTPLSKALRDLTFPTFNRADAALTAWRAGESFTYHAPTGDMPNAERTPAVIDDVASILKVTTAASTPFMEGESWIGVLLIDNPKSGAPPSPENAALLRAVVANACIALRNARLYTRTKAELEAKNYELSILNQIDRELMETIKINYVFDMTLDWAIRYTNAQAASLAIYDEEKGELRVARDLGYDAPPEQLKLLRDNGGGIPRRVARSGHAEVIPDVTTDADYVLLSNHVRAHMSVPVWRQDKVIAVISVESRRLNGFNEDHQKFVEKLAVRAGVAIDNARLFSDSVREREKLSHILSSVADVVIVVGLDDFLILVNQSAISAFRLYADRKYVDEAFSRVFGDSPLAPVFQQAKISGHTVVQEVKLQQQTYYVSLSPLQDIGWIIVMHDITPLKETEQLKSELLATVSHDLKQPLSIMNGYIELMQIQKRLDEVGLGYSQIVLRSIENMRRLIDDFLDFAKIESGITLHKQPIAVQPLINECIQAVHLAVENKAMQIHFEQNGSLPQIVGDSTRLYQIFINLINNAVKYTPPEGKIRIWVEPRSGGLCIAVQDTGIGIAPEDQAKIFDRFYRVRRAETETIEGTGLGLAIVKRLVELHNGQIGVESRLGEGTTFYVTLPVVEQKTAEAAAS